ncbi:MAG: hypothetical protein GXO60_00785 [Epsilonproteobacteria bacterium]|nr:hypothetical protein [Campylobacterota bacterium]
MKSRKRYLIFIFILLFFVSCGNQEYKKSDVKLLKKFPETTLIESIKEPKVEEENSSALLETKADNNSSDGNDSESNNSKVLIFELNSSIVEKNITFNNIIMDKNISEENMTDTNLSVFNKDKNLSLAFADLKSMVDNELKLLKDKKNELSKNFELNVSNNKILASKEVALAKLATQKDIARAEFYNKKELSAMELENKHKLELAKLKATQEIDKIKMEKDKEIAIAKLQNEKDMASSQNKVNLSEQLHKKEVELAKLRTKEKISDNDKKVAITQFSKEKEVELAKLESEKELTNKNMVYKKMIAIIVAGILFFTILVIYLINKRKRDNELKLHESELRHKEYMEASQQHNENIKKILEIITDENADKGIKKEMVKLLKEQGKNKNLIEYKK